MKLGIKLEIEPCQGVAGVRFGMTRTQVRQILGEPDRVFQKTPVELETDAFDHLGIHVFYKAPGLCEAIEFAAPANPTFQGKALLGKPFSELRDWLKQLDDSAEIDDAGLTSARFGLGFYAPFAEESPEAPVESVISFESGYYD